MCACVYETARDGAGFLVARGGGVKLSILIFKENTHFCKWEVGGAVKLFVCELPRETRRKVRAGNTERCA